MAATMKSINVNKEVVFRFPGDKERRGLVSFPSNPNPPFGLARGSDCLSGALSKLGGPLPLLLLILMTCCDGSLPLLESTKKWSGTPAKRDRNQRCQGFVCYVRMWYQIMIILMELHSPIHFLN